MAILAEVRAKTSAGFDGITAKLFTGAQLCDLLFSVYHTDVPGLLKRSRKVLLPKCISCMYVCATWWPIFVQLPNGSCLNYKQTGFRIE